MQIEDILKAAIKDAGLDSNLDILNDTPNSTCTSVLHINTNQDFMHDDDDFNLNDLDFSILNAITPPQSTSPSSSSSVSSVSSTAHSNHHHHQHNPLIPDDSDPFLIALKELDENNRRLEASLQHQSQSQAIQQTVKVVSINNTTNLTNNNQAKTNNSDLLSLLSYRANNPNGTVLAGKKLEKIPNTKLIQKNPIIKNISLNNTPIPATIPTSTKVVASNSFRQINTNTNQLVKPVTNPIKVINLSQIQQKTLNDKLTTNHKLIQITNRPLPISTTTTSNQTQMTHSSLSDNQIAHNNYTTSNTSNTTNNSNIKITKVVSSRPILNNSNQNLIYINNIGSSHTATKTITTNNSLSINGFTNTRSTPTTTTNMAIKTNSLKQPTTHPTTTMRVVGNNLNNISNQPVQYITKIANPLNNSTSGNNIPRFYAKPARIITTSLNSNKSNSEITQTNISSTNNNAITTAKSTTINNNNNNNTHLNILNSNISRYLNQSKLNINNNNNIPTSTTTTTPQTISTNINNLSTSSVTINPKYLPNINTNIMTTSSNNTNNTITNEINSNITNHFQNYFNNEPDEDVVVEEEEELGHAETYSNYMPSKLKIGQVHPDPIVETSSLASVEPPDIWYNLKMSESVYANGALSALQLEAIVYACQKHQEFLPNNHRCGFLIGDGAGVGKGRTIAGMIYENYLVGRKKALWLSVSNDLKFDSQRDLADIGANKIQVHSLNKLKYCKISSKQNSKIKKGVIFSTYSSLIGESQHKQTKKKYSSRLKQLIQWLGGESFDGLIIFDECHKAKNLVPNGSARPTKTGLAVLELQEKLPNARIVYASATGASEPKNMAYMVRLGLWGAGTPFVDFNDFIQSIEKRGVGAMEIVAMDMKLRGMYIARQLSFSGVTFNIEEIPLRKEYVKMYNDAVRLWVDMKEKFQEAIDLIDTEGKLKKTVWGQFWSSHQRFFKYLCMACKVPHVVDLAKTALKNKKCVVIGLQSTGEARTLEQIDEVGEINEFVSTAKGVLQNLVEKHFPSFDFLQTNNGAKTTQNSNKTKQTKLNVASQYKSNFFDILGVNDTQLKQQQIAIKQQVNKKESKNTQRVNDILQRLSTYTNKKSDKSLKIKQQLSKKKGNKRYRSSSMSSISSMSSVLSSNASNEPNNNNDSQRNSDLDSDNFENSEFSDSYHEDDDDDDEDLDDELEQVKHDDPFKLDDLLYDSNKTKKTNLSDLLDLDLNISSTINNENLFDSDDSDSLFSITKSVPVQSLMNKNQVMRNKQHKLQNGVNLEKKFRKRKKTIKTKSNLNGYQIEEEDDDDNDNELDIIELDDSNQHQQQQINEESTDDEFKLPMKRIKNNPTVNTQDLNENIKDDYLLTSCKLQTNIPKPKPTQPYEIADYICELKRDLLNSIQQLGKRLPANTLDELIDLLDGPERVAEMTGRKGRVVCRPTNTNTNEDNTTMTTSSNYVYETRNETDTPVELMNVVQKEKFMNGEKLIAIISEAASSGISLQANRRYSNQCRRVHITIELPWSADRAIQQFGRTHRSNQVSAPEYVFLISELAGEKRFASTVAKRLESLGALTHGDRRATESRDLSRFNIDNKYGRSALENVIKSICNIEKPMARLPKNYSGNFMKDAREALHGVGIIIVNKNGQSAYPDKDYNSINKFLNRLLGCPVELQNAIFTFFSDVLSAVILEAKRTGKWDMGILDLGSNNEIVFRKETKFYVLNSTSDTMKRVEMHTVLVERGLSWEKALEIYRKANNQNNDETTSENDFNLINASNSPVGFYISTQVKNNHKIAILAISALPDSDQSSNKSNFLSIYRPNTGLQVRQETTESILKKYKKVSPSEARSHWIEQYVKSAIDCTHVYRQAHCINARNCEVGLRTRKFYILAGSVLTVWSRVETALSNLTCSSQFRLQIIRVKTDDNHKIVGCVIPTMCLKQIDALLCSMSSKSYVQTHQNETNSLTSTKDTNNITNQIVSSTTSLATQSSQPVLPQITPITPTATSSVNKQITPVISFKTKSIFKVDSLTSFKTSNVINNNNNNNSNNNYALMNRNNKCDSSINYSNPIINYDFT